MPSYCIRIVIFMFVAVATVLASHGVGDSVPNGTLLGYKPSLDSVAVWSEYVDWYNCESLAVCRCHFAVLLHKG